MTSSPLRQNNSRWPFFQKPEGAILINASPQTAADLHFMRQALRLAKRGLGFTSPNPMVGAVIVRNGKVLGTGWHHRTGEPHAEIEAFRDASRSTHGLRGATLYVTLEPCSTFGRTPPCTDAIISHGIKRLVVAATDPNPAHAGTGFQILRNAGIDVATGVLEREATELNAAFNHWIVHQTPFVTVKAAMSLDGKTATASGDSKWITSERARLYAMKLRLAQDAIIVGVNTVLADDPSLTVRLHDRVVKVPRRIVLDPTGRINRNCKLLRDEFVSNTTIVLSEKTSTRIEREILRWGATVLRVPTSRRQFDLAKLVYELGKNNIASALVEGGGETAFSFLRERVVQRVLFFYAPKILGGRAARKGIAGIGFETSEAPNFRNIRWRKIGEDLLLSADLHHSP